MSVVGVLSQEQAAAPTDTMSRLWGARSACPEPHSSPQCSPCTPNTQAQAPIWGATPQNPTTSPGHAMLKGDSALKLTVQRGPHTPGPSTPQPTLQGQSRIPCGHVSISCEHCTRRASCLLSLASSNTAHPGECAGEKDGNNHLSREP